MKKKEKTSPFAVHVSGLGEEEAEQLNGFFVEFDEHCFLPRPEKQKLRHDFERAILYYASIGVSQEQALERLAIANLGGFYARPPILWFALDDAAKIYPLSMKHGQMAVFRLSAYLKSPVVPEFLQMALSFTIKPFPSFATTLKQGFFWHYLDTAKRRFCAEQVSGKLSGTRPCRIVHFKMNAAELKAASKKYNTTITSYLLALMFLAQKAATDDLRGEFSIQVPVNMRKFYPSQTVRNFAMYCGIRLPIEEIRDVPSIVDEITLQLREKASKESMSQMMTATENMVGLMRYIPLAVIQPVAKLVYGFLGDKIFTNTLSNIGVVKFPKEIADQIESMDFVLGTAIINRAGCALVTVNNTATFSITKMTADPSFEEAFYELLRADGISTRADGSGLYEA